jgi:hypothetical protein
MSEISSSANVKEKNRDSLRTTTGGGISTNKVMTTHDTALETREAYGFSKKMSLSRGRVHLAMRSLLHDSNHNEPRRSCIYLSEAR